MRSVNHDETSSCRETLGRGGVGKRTAAWALLCALVALVLPARPAAGVNCSLAGPTWSNCTPVTGSLSNDVMISGDITIPSTGSVTVTIPSGKTLTVAAGKSLTNLGTIAINSSGTLTVQSDAALYNGGTITNSGSINSSGVLGNTKPPPQSGNGTINNTGGTITAIAQLGPAPVNTGGGTASYSSTQSGCTAWPGGTQIAVTADAVKGFWIRPCDGSIIYFDGSTNGGNIKAEYFSQTNGTWAQLGGTGWESLSEDPAQIELSGDKFCLYNITPAAPGTSTGLQVLMDDSVLKTTDAFRFNKAAQFQLNTTGVRQTTTKNLDWAAYTNAATALTSASTSDIATLLKWTDIDPTGAFITDEDDDILLLFYKNNTSSAIFASWGFLGYGASGPPPNRAELLISPVTTGVDGCPTGTKKTILLADDDEGPATSKSYNFNPFLQVGGQSFPVDPTLINKGAPPPPP